MMKAIPFYKNHNIVFGDPSWNIIENSDYSIILKYVIKEFEKVGICYSNYRPVLVMKSIGFDYPMCSDGGHFVIIYLTTNRSYWCQLIYQFAHEFCHYSINGPLDGDLITSFWFEESICEMASRYFLRAIKTEWENNTSVENRFKSFTTCLIDYYCNIDSNTISDNTPLNQWIKNNMKILIKPECQRELYNCIAMKLLPYFVNNPKLWQLLPFLSRVPQEEYHNFDYWINVVVKEKVPCDLIKEYEEFRDIVCL